MKKLFLVLYLIVFLTAICKSQDSSLTIVYKHKKFERLGANNRLTLYKKANSNKYYYKVPSRKKLKRLTYFNIIHINSSTYQLRENCRELRRRKIRLREKYKDGDYFIFKVFNTHIQ